MPDSSSFLDVSVTPDQRPYQLNRGTPIALTAVLAHFVRSRVVPPRSLSAVLTHFVRSEPRTFRTASRRAMGCTVTGSSDDSRA
ncbi:hypothetical protein C494_04850 [Natronorubrum bangense JCM 10635]|uniref:Uncharacterized protein n=1 Tax=Natronorubrum bangense JCM 10635 TaxID=1227500 RepID=L9WMI3_9EURY|nr:hypothetical protein C494_04850 [Natronorubrum bangense JCM 10635]